jgi:Ca-activated chloride channel family protein
VITRLVVVAGLALGVLGVPGSAQTFRSTVDLVSLGVTVTDRQGTFVTDLAADDFEVLEDGKSQRITLFALGSADPAPALHLGVLFDCSGSMDEDIKFSRSAAIKFLNTLPDAADVTLVDFDTEIRVARYSQADFPRLVERIRRRKPDGYTALHDAMGVYLDGAAGQEGRKIFVLYTDGMDTSSAMTFGETLDLLRASDVTMYVVGFLGSAGNSRTMEQRLRLQQMTDTTGGLAFFPLAIKDLDATYAKVVAEIRAQYTLGYVSANTRSDGHWRKIEIKVKRPTVKVRSRQGYFALFRQ